MKAKLVSEEKKKLSTTEDSLTPAVPNADAMRKWHLAYIKRFDAAKGYGIVELKDGIAVLHERVLDGLEPKVGRRIFVTLTQTAGGRTVKSVHNEKDLWGKGGYYEILRYFEVAEPDALLWRPESYEPHDLGEDELF